MCPRYPSPALPEKILAGGSRPIVQLEPWEPHKIGDFTVYFVSEESPMNHDSAMVIEANGTTTLNMNDARLTSDQVRRIMRESNGIDILFLQAAGASWFPICHEYDAPRIRELSRSKRLAKLRYVAKMMALAQPVVTIPFAGPPAFLDDELRWVNDQMGPEGIFPDQAQALDWLATEIEGRAELFLPGDEWDHDARQRRAHPQWEGFRFDDRETYLSEYAERRRSDIGAVKDRHRWPDQSLWEPFREYFAHVLDMSAYFNEHIGIRVGFDVRGRGGGKWAVDFRPGEEGVFSDFGEPHYVYRFDARWLPPLLDGSVPWEDFFLSCRFNAWRSPDVYNDHLLGLLKFAWPEALDAVEDFESADKSGATIVVESNGVRYEVPRYCPHAGQDLAETSEVLASDVLMCLGHHYEFDLRTGECINGKSKPLEVRRLS